MELNYEVEYNDGKRDAAKDIEKHGLDYALGLVDGQDMADPYIAGYMDVIKSFSK